MERRAEQGAGVGEDLAKIAVNLFLARDQHDYTMVGRG